MSGQPMDEEVPQTARRAWISAATILLAIVAAIVVVHNELVGHSIRQIVHEVRAIPLRYMVVALLFTVAGYGVLTIYDILALRYARVKLSLPRTAFASFIAFAFSNTLGWP